MNIVEAMKYVKSGRKIMLHDKIIRLSDNGHLMRNYSRDYKIKGEELYTPTMADMISDDWELVTEEIPNGAIVRICETDLTVFEGHRGRKYLIDVYNHTVVVEYENENLMLIDIDRRGGELVWC